MYVKRSACLFFLCLLFAHITFAQTCGNCKEIPKIAAFDFDVQVAKPDSLTGTLWPEWKSLFLLAGTVSSQIANNEKACLRITQPPSVDTGDVELVSVGGETFTNLPSNPLINPDLSTYGDYILTGNITGTGDGMCRLHVVLQTSCSRKTVLTADVSFALSSLTGNVGNLARQAVTQLSPLADKIKDFELKEREQDKSLSLFQSSWGEPIRITPQKKTLKSGESTVFTIELKDCDGKPLAGREIYFSESSFEGFEIAGTIGGSVSPAKVITDANGMAKASFTLKPGQDEALIAAHSPGKDVKGCNSMFFGDAPINIKYTYSGYVIYTYEGFSRLITETEDKISNNYSKGKETTSVNYRASFYGEGSGGGLNLSSDEESDPTKVPDILGSGKYGYSKSDYGRHTIICNCASKGEVTEQTIRADADGDLIKSNISFGYGEDMGKIDLDLYFKTANIHSYQATLMPSQSSTSVEEMHWPVNFDTFFDKTFTAKKERAGNRTRYIFEGTRNISLGNGYQLTRIKLVVMEE